MQTILGHLAEGRTELLLGRRHKPALQAQGIELPVKVGDKIPMLEDGVAEGCFPRAQFAHRLQRMVRARRFRASSFSRKNEGSGRELG